MTHSDLAALGWSAFFRAQLAPDTALHPARVMRVDRDRLVCEGAAGPVTRRVPPGQSTGDYAVGDWVPYDPGTMRAARPLDRQSVLQRRAAGARGRVQLIAANVDTVGIVTSCNDDFSEARLERYLALTASAGAVPLVILTKADLAVDPAPYRRRAEALSPLVAAVPLDARDAGAAERLRPWCDRGQTLALVGSSGVGKTTVSNALTGRRDSTRTIREDDAKGRHTTTARGLWPTRAGGWLVDTPGMRELGLAEAAAGIAALFGDIETLAAACRFSDCAHESEPGCAVQAAIADGTLPAERLTRWHKLCREEAQTTRSVAEARAADRARERLYRSGKARGRAKRAP